MWPVDTSILLTRIECVSVRSCVSVTKCGHIVHKGKDSVNEEDANEGSQVTENANDQNQG
jgi:hypothetical protein